MKRPGLLVSVRSATEAVAALEGGADLIDVKEPAHGPLGKASDTVIAEVLACVADRRPVSAAMGELADGPLTLAPPGLSFLKWGLARCRNLDWRRALDALLQGRNEKSPICVTAAYADWQLAQAPRPEEVLDFLRGKKGCGFLLDTFTKAPGVTLLDWVSDRQLLSWCALARETKIPVALAGSLGPGQIRRLRNVPADWFAVRGAACLEGSRAANIQESCVRELARALSEHEAT